MKPLFSPDELPTVRALAAITYTNPFKPERMAHEKQALGSDFEQPNSAWNIRYDDETASPNLIKLEKVNTHWADIACERLRKTKEKISTTELVLYEELVINHLFNSYRQPLVHTINANQPDDAGKFFTQFNTDYQRYLKIPGRPTITPHTPEHLYALFYQVHRAFYYVFEYIVGASQPTTQLRINIWQSIFTHNMQRYAHNIYAKMSDFTTLITGPSGTGKELVARAISLSRYIPFNKQTKKFKENYLDQFFPLQLSAMSPNLIESELFGHKRGAYTGATEDRKGWLEICAASGTVFLDEIGEINETIQVKLLRVLQSRSFQRLGDTEYRTFSGKIVAATNRNLMQEVANGNFRQDLYYRICSDIIETPALKDQLENQTELINLVHILSKRITGPKDAESLTTESMQWITKQMPAEYHWPGNVRELEQCIRNILIRGSYTPKSLVNNTTKSWLTKLEEGTLSAEEVLNNYCRLVFEKNKSYSETARQIGLDRRTVKAKINAFATD